jgi:hypothetical protein
LTLMETQAARTTATDAELDEALTRAIRQLIAEAMDAGAAEVATPAA